MKTIAILSLLGAANGRLSFGTCPEVNLQSNFDANAYGGKWYEIKRDKIFTFEMGQECVTENFTPDGNGNHNLYFRGWFWMAFFTY